MPDNDNIPFGWGNDEEESDSLWTDDEEDNSAWGSDDEEFAWESDNSDSAWSTEDETDVTVPAENDSPEKPVNKKEVIGSAAQAVERDEVYAAMLRSIQRSAKRKKIIKGVIIALIAAAVIGVLGFFAVKFIENFKEKNNSHDKSYSTIVYVTENTEEKINETTTFVTTVTTSQTTTAVISTTVVTTEAENNIGLLNPSLSSGETNNEHAVNVTYNVYDYPQYVNRLQKIFMLSAMESDYVKFNENDLSQTYSYGDIYSIGYLLQDLNSDGTPELITVTGEMINGASSIAEVYSILDDELILLCRSTDKVWYSLCENNIISCTVKMNAGHPAVDYLEYFGGNTLNIVSCSAESIKADCEPLSELEFISLQSFIGFGFVKTDEGGLNLRTEPSTSSGILHEIPKGDIIFIYEDISGWYNVMHNEIFGYVSKEFVDAYFFN